MVGYEGRSDYTASGTAVNLAARLSDLADDGEILLSPRAYTAVEDDFAAVMSEQLAYIRSLAFWPLRIPWWYFVRRSQRHDKPLAQLENVNRF